ncbi:unnamed protein product [Cylicostephanus goldi]|uniref:BESS domain-containing protein n=1 Tax=Cylicostephanus goldi TaxID=71465 RepID=A0A3P6RVY1_CYLGO|nr:unnamed protein product [Cylicostephanus goldi]
MKQKFTLQPGNLSLSEKFFPQKRAAQEHMPPPMPPIGPAFMPPPPGVLPPPGVPAVPPPPFMMAPPIPSKEAKRIKFNDEESDENELFAKLLYKKLKSITSRKRLEILHVSIMEMVRQAQEEDERERTVTGMDPNGPQMI